MLRWALTAIALLGVGLAAAPAQAQPRIVALSTSDEAAYRDAFEAAARGDAAAVRARLAHVEDDILVGAALGESYLSANRRAYPQLVAWLNRYPDLAIAQDVYERAQRIRPRRARRAPLPDEAPRRAHPWATRTPAGDTAAARAQIAAIQELLGQGLYEDARVRGEAALSGPRDGQAHWLLGLAAFRLRDYAGATQHFEASARWPNHDRLSGSAAHYWAARARLAAGDARGVIAHLESAAQFPMTFYG
ncbi:MAG: tol-pal system YbgF family protein, partial [Hyphomonadaceae bacterium]